MFKAKIVICEDIKGYYDCFFYFDLSENTFHSSFGFREKKIQFFKNPYNKNLNSSNTSLNQKIFWLLAFLWNAFFVISFHLYFFPSASLCIGRYVDCGLLCSRLVLSTEPGHEFQSIQTSYGDFSFKYLRF